LAAPTALTQAIDDVCADAGVTRATLRMGGGVLHDPFPSIELLTLRELGGWHWALEAFAAGWGHPFGGLPGSGHALGNTGLMVLAQATAWLSGDAHLLDLRVAPPPPSHVLATSVGSPFSRVLCALLARPDWLFLDEATASMDPASEQQVLQALRTELPNTTIISIVHRPEVAALFPRQVTFHRDDNAAGQIVDITAK
jgi:hypothetical protein